MSPQPRQEPEFDAFLSYSREDEPRVRLLQDALAAEGLRLWRDREQIRAGDGWISRLEQGLRRSRAIILFVSQTALASDWVQREWNVALTLGMRILPVRLDGSPLPVILSPIQFVEFPSDAEVAVVAASLVAGIRSEQPLPPPPSTASSNPSVLGREVAVIQRMLQASSRSARSLQSARIVASLTGVACAAGAPLLPESASGWTPWISGGSLLLAASVVWAITERLRLSRDELRGLSSLKDGIELYCPNQPACLQFRVKFEALLKQQAGIQEVG